MARQTDKKSKREEYKKKKRKKDKKTERPKTKNWNEGQKETTGWREREFEVWCVGFEGAPTHQTRPDPSFHFECAVGGLDLDLDLVTFLQLWAKANFVSNFLSSILNL